VFGPYKGAERPWVGEHDASPSDCCLHALDTYHGYIHRSEKSPRDHAVCNLDGGVDGPRYSPLGVVGD
jgi:hypothetical protein